MPNHSDYADDHLMAYQESGLSHVTVFVAFMFGLFSVLVFMNEVVKNKQDILYFITLSFVYWLLWLGGLYCLSKFFLYLELRDYVMQDKHKDEKNRKKYRDDYIKDLWKNRSGLRKRFSGLADFVLTGGLFKTHSFAKMAVIISLYFFMGFTPYIVVFLISISDLPFLFYVFIYIIFIIDVAIPPYCFFYAKKK